MTQQKPKKPTEHQTEPKTQTAKTKEGYKKSHTSSTYSNNNHSDLQQTARQPQNTNKYLF